MMMMIDYTSGKSAGRPAGCRMPACPQTPRLYRIDRNVFRGIMFRGLLIPKPIRFNNVCLAFASCSRYKEVDNLKTYSMEGVENDAFDKCAT